MQTKHGGFRQGFMLLTGGVIGAGFFAMPRSVDTAGAVSSILIITGVGILVTIMHLILAEVSLSLPGHKTFIGMANNLFPKRLARATLYINTINNLVGIIAYIILGGTFLQTLLGYLGVNRDTVWWMFLYFVLIGYFGAISIKTLNKYDTIIVIILLGSIGLIIVSAMLLGERSLSTLGSFHDNFRLYGIGLFSLSSINAIPLLYHTTGSSAIKMRNVIIASGCTTTLIAICFALSIISLSTYIITDDGIGGLAVAGFNILAIIGSIAGLAAIVSSHIPVLENTQEVFVRDLRMNKLATWICVTMVPFIIILYLDIQLLDLLGTAGSLLGGCLFFLACLLNIYLHRTKQKVRIVPMISNDQIRSWILAIICTIGILYQILSFY